MKKLFEPTRLGSMNLKNRLWRSATWENMADDRGHMTPQLLKVYEKLALGGVGTIVTGYTYVREEEQPNPGMMGIYNDSFIAEYRVLTKLIHNLGANIVMQLVYGGSQTSFRPETRQIWGPSAVAEPNYGVIPIPMTRDDIRSLTTSFVQAARRAKEAGFDGVQLHGGHGYLLSQFLTPSLNQRDDKYGGSIENRARIIFEIVEAIRAEVGPDYPVLIKMNSSDGMGDAGLTVEECIQVALGLKQRGITAIELSGGMKTDPVRTRLFAEEAQSYFRKPAEEIAARVELPFIMVGGNRSVAVMEDVLATTAVEYFSLARTLLSEPDLPNKWQGGFRGRPRCVSCNRCWGQDVNICVLDRAKDGQEEER